MIERMKRERIRHMPALAGLLVAFFALTGQAAAKGKANSGPQPSTADEPTSAARKPSTAAERTGAAKAARELEADPVGPGAEARRKTAKLVLEAPDI